MNMMTYKGLSARVEYDADDVTFVGRIVGINDVIGFHSDNAAELQAAFHEAVDDYLETCAKAGKEPEKAFSGKLMLRIDPRLHRSLATAAELAGVSLNQLGEGILNQGLLNTANSDSVAVPGSLTRSCAVFQTNNNAKFDWDIVATDGNVVRVRGYNRKIDIFEDSKLVKSITIGENDRAKAKAS